MRRSSARRWGRSCARKGSMCWRPRGVRRRWISSLVTAWAAWDSPAKPIHAEEMTLSVRKALETYELRVENKRKLRQLKTLVDSARKLSEISQEELSYQS